jgi:glycosyltransferase involved in cell wall biosynthesis
LRIGFDASVIFSSAGGTRVYAIQLLTALLDLKPDWKFFLYSRTEQQARDLKEMWTAPNVEATLVAGAPNALRIQARLPAQLRHDAVDVYHSLGYFLPLRWAGPKVVTVHDLNIYLNWPSWLRSGRLFRWADMAVQTPLAVRAADRIITDSEYSKGTICKILRVEPSRVAVVPLAPDPFFDEAPSAAEIDEARASTGGAPYVLYVGVLSPQKNLGMLIKAFAASSLPRGGARLVLAGSDSGHGAELRAQAAAAGVARQVQLTGFISRPLLRALYRQSLAVVLPSHGEGFGLPLVEAMASGVPVLAANRQSLPEVVGDAGCLFEPDDVDGLSDQLSLLLAEPSFRKGLVERGRARRPRFSWSAAAAATAAIYEEVATVAASSRPSIAD